MGRRKPLLTVLRELGIVPRSYSPPPPVRPVPPVRFATCELCGARVRLTTRGSLYLHRPDPALLRYCYGGVEPVRYRRRGGLRPDLAFPSRESAAYLLELLEEQDRKRGG